MSKKTGSISLSQQGYESIRQKIVSLELPPGAVIDESALQTELNLGRTPIREALKQLSFEKLVTIVPRRGMFVTDISITDLQRLFEVRIELEGMAAALAAQRGTAKQWNEMESVLSDLLQNNQDNDTLIQVDEKCHQIIYAATDNEFLIDILNTHYALSLRLWFFALPQVGDMKTAIVEHQSILDALRNHDGEQASYLIKQHIWAFQEKMQSIMLGIPPVK